MLDELKSTTDESGRSKVIMMSGGGPFPLTREVETAHTSSAQALFERIRSFMALWFW
jgi:hypothetical protein